MAIEVPDLHRHIGLLLEATVAAGMCGETGDLDRGEAGEEVLTGKGNSSAGNLVDREP